MTQGGSGTAATRPAPPVRQKSGLVRSASGFDAFVFALSGISVGIMFEWGSFFATGFYPGGNEVVAVLISVAAALVVAFAYRYWGQIFPRSGGDYVFLSRGFHPGFALGVNFVYCWILMVSPAFAMSIMQPLLSSFASVLASATGWHFLDSLSTWFGTNVGYAVIGTVDLLLAASIGVFGLKRSIRYMKSLFYVGLGAEVILVVALLFSHTSTFAHHLQAATGHTVAQIESKAVATGYQHGGFNLFHTFRVTDWYVTSLFFAALLLYIGGEIKNAARNIRRALVTAVIFSGFATLVWVVVLNHVVPTVLQGALAWNSFAAPAYSTLWRPYPHELMAVLWGTSGGGLILTIIAFLGCLAWVTLWTPLVLSFAQRGILAWALDGLAPRWVGRVNERYHTPIPALLIALFMGESFMLWFRVRPRHPHDRSARPTVRRHRVDDARRDVLPVCPQGSDRAVSGRRQEVVRDPPHVNPVRGRHGHHGVLVVADVERPHRVGHGPDPDLGDGRDRGGDHHLLLLPAGVQAPGGRGHHGHVQADPHRMMCGIAATESDKSHDTTEGE